jgi:hypothetical protein
MIGFPRAYAEFTNPDDETEIYKVDLTWLTSRWECIFGRGCPGIYADRPDDGCCTLGAHFADADDEKRVRKAVKQLDAETWQYYKEGRRGGWIELEDPETVTPGEEPDRKTRVVDGACIFLNRPGFPAGEGCALHHLAVRQDRHFHETKPDVCWQLPLRRQFREVTRTDGSEYTEVTIGEYSRDGWGPGGHDLDWYCTANTEAHQAKQPVYLNNRPELIALMGEAGYELLKQYCEEFDSRRGKLLRHPADPPRKR